MIERSARTAASLLCLLFALQMAAQQARLVDPFIGAAGPGHVFPGATLPFGMLKAGPDTGDNSANSGWTPNGLINGFSQTHVSGTGGGAKYGNILVQPTIGELDIVDHGSLRTNERATPGSYSVTLSRYHVSVEVAAARRSALYRFTFPATVKANVLLDVAHCLSSFARQKEDQAVTSSSIHVLSPTEVSGSTSVTGGWNAQTNSYTVYFYAVFDKAAQSYGTWQNGTVRNGAAAAESHDAAATGAWLQFPPRHTVQMKIGISFMGVEQARRNVTQEIPRFDLDRVRTQAQQTWDRSLSALTVSGVSGHEQTQFYSAMYRTMLMPVDRTGENPLFSSTEPAYDDFYAIWDTFRTSTQLLTLVAPKQQSGMVRSLVDLYRHEGWLPDARSGNFNGRVQGGSDADMMLADGYLKHLPGVDWNTAYEAMVKDAEQTSAEPNKQGRSDLDDWKKLGYLSMEGTDRPVSKGMEYAANDYAVAVVAQGLGKEADYRKYSQRAGNWKNYWELEASDEGFTGFVWSRHRDGTWKQPFSALHSGTWGSDGFYEGNPWTYSTFVPQDVGELIRFSGGPGRFVQRMDAFFQVPGRYDVGNEPGFLAPYLYLWAGRPDRTQATVREILAKNYHNGPAGLPGNDDSGAMSSWYIFGKLGLYPIAAQDVYVFGSPAYPRVNLLLPNGRMLRIETEGVSQPYIASVTWNGKPFPRCWFTHEQLMAGGLLHIVMSATPTRWGAKEPPPSMSDQAR